MTHFKNGAESVLSEWMSYNPAGQVSYFHYGNGINAKFRHTGGGGGGGGKQKSNSNKQELLCTADVALNFAAGFLPGYNALRIAGEYFGYEFNPFQAVFGDKDTFMVETPGALEGAAAGSSWIALHADFSFRDAGGEEGLERVSNLITRGSFKRASPGRQAKLLKQAANLARLGRAASVAGGVSQILNAGLALKDLHACWNNND